MSSSVKGEQAGRPSRRADQEGDNVGRISRMVKRNDLIDDIDHAPLFIMAEVSA